MAVFLFTDSKADARVIYPTSRVRMTTPRRQNAVTSQGYRLCLDLSVYALYIPDEERGKQ
jgi:hypothetical protein